MQNLRARPQELLDLRWVANSKFLWRRKDGGELDRKDLRTILTLKKSTSKPEDGGSDHGKIDSALELIRLGSLADEVGTLKDEIRRKRNEWIIIDTTFMSAENAYKLASSLLGSLDFVTANKTAWADRGMCQKLYSTASQTRTLLGLNCTVGVWADQMEYVPLFLKILRRREGQIAKRDNSSLNLFLAKVGEGFSPKKALAAVVAGGYLEPGAVDLAPEVKDQIIKLKVASNVCAAITGFSIAKSSEKTLQKLEPSLMRRATTEDLAKWHLSGRQHGLYPALLSRITLKGSSEAIEMGARFTELDGKNPLAKDFRGKNAISLSFVGKGPEFVHAGYGGAPRTAKKLLWEAERIAKLSKASPSRNFDPLPVVVAVRSKDPDALWKQSSLLSKID